MSLLLSSSSIYPHAHLPVILLTHAQFVLYTQKTDVEKTWTLLRAGADEMQSMPIMEKLTLHCDNHRQRGSIHTQPYTSL